MRMNFGEVIEIEDLGNHSPATVVNLAILMAGGVNAKPDPKRKDCYEIEGEPALWPTVYYVYVSPFTHTIFLIACWKNVLPPLTQLDAVAYSAEARQA
jgi:hypothetical protein